MLHTLTSLADRCLDNNQLDDLLNDIFNWNIKLEQLYSWLSHRDNYWLINDDKEILSRSRRENTGRSGHCHFFFFFPKRPACVHVFTGGAHSKAVLIPRWCWWDTLYYRNERVGHAEYPGSIFWLLLKHKGVMDYRKTRQDINCEGSILRNGH